MINKIKLLINSCVVACLLTLFFVGCTQPTIPETKYKVSFDINGHGTQPLTIEVSENTILSEEQLQPLHTEDEFTFGGWFDGENKAIAGKYKVTKNVKLKAEWTVWEKVSEVSFNTNNIDVDYNDEVILTCATPDAIIHYSFDNQEEKTCSSGEKVNITGSPVNAYATKKGMKKSNTTTASYTIKTYTVTFNQNGHGFAPTSIPNLKKGDKVTKPTDLTTEDEFNFIGWCTDDACTKPWIFKTYVISDNITLYANWKAWDKVNDVTFSINNNQEVDYTDKVTLNCGTEGATIHYYFEGQSVKTCSPGSAVEILGNKISAYATKEKMSQSSTTTANYTIKTHTVTFDANGHGKAPAKLNLKKGEKVTKPEDLSADGVFFVGWFNGDNKIISDIVIEKSDITLTARWCKIADVILNDGTYVSNSSITEEQKSKAIAVVCGKNEKGKILGLGLRQNEDTLKWSDKSNRINDIICTPNKSDTNEITFTGDTDGNDNWNVIVQSSRKNDPNYPIEMLLDSYPAFAWANNYGTKYNLLEGYKDGWYIPSIAELTDICRNKVEINKTITKLNEINTGIASLLKDDWYYSSSQCGHNNNFAWVFYFDILQFNSCRKNIAGNVCCIRAF